MIAIEIFRQVTYLIRKMNIPAYTSPTLCIGRTFDAEKATACGDIFPAGIPTKPINVNKFSFKYTVVKGSKDVQDLLDVSGELSLKIKANLLKVEGAGQYINDTKKEEGTTTLLAVMKCTTVTETIDGKVDPIDNPLGVGTHYVRSVTYGAELVAKLKFKTVSSTKTEDIKGRAEGNLTLQAVDVGLKAELQKLTSEFESLSDLEVNYYSTGLPNKLPITIDGLTQLIETFPSRMKEINDGKGIPITFELLPITNIIPTARAYLQDRVEAFELEEMEDHFDDLHSALDLANAYRTSTDEQHDDVVKFISETKKVERVFRKAISALGRSGEKQQLEASQDAYEGALGGLCVDGKFVQQWKKIYSTKTPTTSIKLPEGKELSLVLLGKTGNGKSKTGNSILGQVHFKASSVAESVTKSCSRGVRKSERKIDLIDTPGVLDTSAVSLMDKAKNVMAYLTKNDQVQNKILQEVARIFAMAPDGFDCFIVVAKYGCRFTAEDAQALKMLQKLLGQEACDNMVLVLTHGDQAEREAEENGETVDQTLAKWLESLPKWVKEFVAAIKDRVFLFNNCLRPEKEPDEYKKQLSRLIKMIDEMTKGRNRFVHKLTSTSKDVLEQEIKEALDQSGINEQLKSLQEKKEELEKQKDELEADDKKRKELDEMIKQADKEKDRIDQQRLQLEKEKTEKQKQDGGTATEHISEQVQSGGCYPGSATFADIHGRPREMETLKVGDKVQVMTNKGIREEPVITFIHRQPGVIQEFLKIETLKKKILKITEDHVLFVKKGGQAAAIPARDVNIGDTVYVKGDQGAIEEDAVHSISSVFEKGVYAPVTLSGTILVNDVHTSCYFDVLSHEWSHRAMGIARAVYRVSPWMVQWISNIGQKDGFPGWCRLVHKMLTSMD